MRLSRLFALAAIGLIGLVGPAHAQDLPRWGERATPMPGRANVHGGYSAGCLTGAATLPLDGAGYQVMRPSRNRNHGHPALLALLGDLATGLETQGQPGLLIGDLAQPRGGPMLSGHASHQIGLDADIWFLPEPGRRLNAAEREELSAQSVLNAGQTGVDPARFGARERTMLRLAAQHPDTARLFVHPAIKRHLCRSVSDGRDWLAKVRPWWGHHYHFHVRMNCPADSPDCRPQAPVPAGDGCDATLDWWFSDEAAARLAERSRPRPAPARPRSPLADLPQACRAVLLYPG